MVSIGNFSRELCGGTHLSNTGQIGLCKIVSDESVAAGTRRIVALTGLAALRHVREQELTLRELSQILKAPPAEVARRAQALYEEIHSLKKKLTERRKESTGTSMDELIASATRVAGVNIVAREVAGATADDMRQQIDLLRRKASPIAVLLASQSDGKIQLIAGLSRELVERGLDAAKWVKETAKVVGGGGGGRADLAQAGGKDPARLPQALEFGIRYIQEQLTKISPISSK
jgi:alanyl-tRNA synthetase